MTNTEGRVDSVHVEFLRLKTHLERLDSTEYRLKRLKKTMAEDLTRRVAEAEERIKRLEGAKRLKD